ncbi:MAG: 50S ribosomal protein L12 [Candidatus Aenigmarchaeota archaeon]|nr:50S ribosomal protein L12 [Candidatus Aenigmarchaeota archaeon]
MQEIYSALLLHSAGKPITEENIKKVLEGVGATVDEGKIKALVTSLEGQNIDELLKQAVVTPAPPEKKEEKKAEEEEKKAEEAATVGLSSLFG